MTTKYYNNWTPEITKKIEKIKEKAWSYTWIHRENSIYLADIYEWVSIIAYSLSFFNGVILIFPTNLIYIRIFNILLSFGSGLLIFYIKTKKLTETAEKHKIGSSKFSNIYNNIERQLSLDVQQRENAQHYHRWISQVFDALYGSAPDIDPPIIDEYIRKFARKRKVNPIEAAEFDKSSSSIRSSSSSETELHEIIVVGSGEKESTHHSEPKLESGSGSNSESENPPSNTLVSHQLKLNKESIDHLELNETIEQGEISSSISSKTNSSELSESSEEPTIVRKKRRTRVLKKQEAIHPSSINHEDTVNRAKLFNYELSRMGMGNMTMGTKCYIPEYELKNQETDIALDPKKSKKKSKK